MPRAATNQGDTVTWDLDQLEDVAIDVARAAGRVLVDHAGRRIEWQTKSTPTDPVTAADRESERLVVEHLIAHRPDDGFVGEEGVGDRSGTTGLRWVVDPLDGTVNFTYGIRRWAVSIAAEDDDGGVVGVVFDPMADELCWAVRGRGSHRDGVDVAVSTMPDPTMALVGTGFYYDRAVREVQGPEVADLVGRVRDVRRAGAAALDLSDVAAGRLDGFVEFGLNHWDWAAGEVLIREAGGRVSRFDRDIAGWHRPVLVAGGDDLHDWLWEWARAHASTA